MVDVTERTALPGIFQSGAHFPLDPFVPTLYDLVVDVEQHPFAAGETPRSYAARIVALVAPGGRVYSVTMHARAVYFLQPAHGNEDTYDQRVDIQYTRARGS